MTPAVQQTALHCVDVLRTLIDTLQSDAPPHQVLAELDDLVIQGLQALSQHDKAVQTSGGPAVEGEATNGPPDPTCATPGCTARARARGLCAHHYTRHRREAIRNGTWNTSPPEDGQRTCDACHATKPLSEFSRNRWGHLHTCRPCWSAAIRRGLSTGPRKAPRCAVPDCTRDVHGHGLCHRHYQRQRRREAREALAQARDAQAEETPLDETRGAKEDPPRAAHPAQPSAPRKLGTNPTHLELAVQQPTHRITLTTPGQPDRTLTAPTSDPNWAATEALVQSALDATRWTVHAITPIPPATQPAQPRIRRQDTA